jgi:hypothetical protein
MLGRWLEGSQSLVEPWLAELVVDERRLHTDAPLDVFEHEAVAMRPKHHATTGAHVVNIVRAPPPPGSKSGTALLSGSASKAVDPVVDFALRRPPHDLRNHRDSRGKV